MKIYRILIPTKSIFALLFIISFVITSACKNSSGSKKAIEDRLRTEAEELKNRPKRLLTEADSFFENKLSFQTAKMLYDSIIKSYPTSEVAKMATIHLYEIDSIIQHRTDSLNEITASLKEIMAKKDRIDKILAERFPSRKSINNHKSINSNGSTLYDSTVIAWKGDSLREKLAICKDFIAAACIAVNKSISNEDVLIRASSLVNCIDAAVAGPPTSDITMIAALCIISLGYN